MHYLDDGILTEILGRLPAKSLLRFKCVCRQWHSLISDPAFARAQVIMSVQESPNPSQGVLLDNNGFGSPLAARMNRDHDSCWNIARVLTLSEEEFVPAECRTCIVKGSCHGLICLRTRMELFLYNPTTRESRQLPQPPGDLHPLAPHGLGYDPLSDDYKLVFDDAIYSLKSDSWRLLYTGKCNRYSSLSGCGKYSDGHLYWLYSDGRDNTIVSFNIAAEEFYEHVLPIPKDPAGDFIQLCASELGWLFVLRMRIPNSSEVWAMKDCHGLNSTWTKLYSFSLEEINGHNVGSIFFNVASLMKDGKVVFLCNRVRGADAGIYDPEEDSWKTLVLPRVPGPFPLRIGSTFVESLVPLHIGN